MLLNGSIELRIHRTKKWVGRMTGLIGGPPAYDLETTDTLQYRVVGTNGEWSNVNVHEEQTPPYPEQEKSQLHFVGLQDLLNKDKLDKN